MHLLSVTMYSRMRQVHLLVLCCWTYFIGCLVAQDVASSGPIPSLTAQTSRSVHDLAIIVSVGSACLCMVLVVVALAVLLLRGKLNPDVLGSWKGVGAGSGLAGILYVFYLIIKTALVAGS